MQELAIFILLGLASAYIIFKFLIKKNSHDCGSCGLADSNESKKN